MQPKYSSVPSEFVHDLRAPHRGCLDYLGTLGYRHAWANPDHQRKQVRSFASSLIQGRPSDMLALHSPNTFCETGNAPFSFFGFQFMYGRRLNPSCYTLRNLATMQVNSSPIMTSWRFEASNDLKTWQTLDVRYGHLHSQEAL